MSATQKRAFGGLGAGLVCAAVVVLCILAAHPFAEMGFVDDWAYVKLAEVFARTGQVVYNGWETAMLGWEIPWGALFVRLFGASFTAVRMSTLPLAAGSVLLFHSSLRRFGATPRNAVIGALALGFSPLFFPLAATYMTDLPGLFCVLVCIYLCQRAIQADRDVTAAMWLVAATVTNLVGGTVRQIVWLGALVMVPSALWLMRRRRYVVATGVTLWVISVATVLACMRWFEQQPYVLPEKIYQGRPSAHMLAHGATQLLKTVLCLALLTTPLLVAWLGYLPKLTRAAKWRVGAVLVIVLAAAVVFAAHRALDQRVMPWLGHIIGTQSIFQRTGEMLGQRPVTIGLPIRTALSIFVILLVVLVLEFVTAMPALPMRSPMREALWLLAPFTASYVSFLVPRAIYSFIYDRYLLDIMPGFIVLLILLYQARMAGRLPGICVFAVACFGLYTFAATHDWFALNRARISAVHEIEAQGVPATSIQGGFDYDGWTQIEAGGYVNDERIKRPAHAFHADPETALAPDCRLNFASFTPAIHPKYFVVFHPMPCLAASPFPAVSYRNWLPPFRRTIYIQSRPAPGR